MSSNSSKSSDSDGSEEFKCKFDEIDIPNKKKGPKKRRIVVAAKQSFHVKPDSCSDSEASEEIDNNNLYNEKLENYKKNKNNRGTFSLPFTELYRPKTLDELTLDKHSYEKIVRILAEKNMANIILSGEPGIGKTSTMLFLAKSLLGKYYDEGVIELNASDERGVKTVQDIIEYFCKKKTQFNDNAFAKKIVLLDEADNMTKKAQQFISKLMEEHNATTRFIFTCNNSTDIIETIQSRCVIFRYTKLKQEQIEAKLKQICEKENISYSNEGIEVIANISAGDLRQAINNLQFTYNGYINIIPENVYKLCDTPHPFLISQIFVSCYKKDIKNALTIFNDLNSKGYSSSDISLSMVETLKNMDKSVIDEKTRIVYLREVCKACLVISRGVNTPLQLTGTIAMLCK